MPLTISKARQNLFSLAEAASRGERVEFVYKGTTIRLVPDKKPSKLSRLTPMNLLAPGDTFEKLDADLKKISLEIQLEWERNNR